MKLDVPRYKQIVILTGAGVSAASGLRTYRGEGGVWDEYDVETYGHVDCLRTQPQRTWQLFGSLRKQLPQVHPNRAHYALAELEKQLGPEQQLTLITQNIDGLHQLAGSRNVIEFHGSIRFTRCSNEACDLAPFADTHPHQNSVPLCPRCASVLRPDIVLFGEQIPIQASGQAKRALRDCDLFIAVGTSGTVAPASSFVYSAAYAGAETIYVNLQPMQPRNPAFKTEYIGKAEEILPMLFGTE